jgi:nitrite reductase/ring-hydroxylating ferredoxin subunit
MAGEDWAFVIDDAALPEGVPATAHCFGAHVVLAKVAGAVYAVSDKCPHMGCPLSRGKLEGYTLTCPCHDWRFDVRSGRFIDAPELGLDCFPVKSEAGKVFVGPAKSDPGNPQ